MKRYLSTINKSSGMKNMIMILKHFILIFLALIVCTSSLPIEIIDKSSRKPLSNIERLNARDFLNLIIDGEKYDVKKLANAITTKNPYYDKLLNKAARFNTFNEIQNYTTNLYGKNCITLNSDLKIEILRNQKIYESSVENSKLLHELTNEKYPKFEIKYRENINSLKSSMTNLLAYENEDCNRMLSVLKQRNKGVFQEEKIGKNLISLNFITNPVDEIVNNSTQKFTSANILPNINFALKLKLPYSWQLKNKDDFSNNSTVLLAEPFEKFLNGAITASIYRDFVPKDKETDLLTDNEITEIFYSDDELLNSLISRFNINIKNEEELVATKYTFNGKDFILYAGERKIASDIVDNMNLKYLNALTFHNGALIKMSFSGGSKDNELNSFNYYSRLYFKVLSSIQFNPIEKNVIYLSETPNGKILSTQINNYNYEFILDTGASDIVINKTVLNRLLSQGFITRNNFIKTSFHEIANGDVVECENWQLPEIRIGNSLLKNINVVVMPSEESSLLFGMNGVNSLNVSNLNLKENKIVLTRE